MTGLGKHERICSIINPDRVLITRYGLMAMSLPRPTPGERVIMPPRFPVPSW